MGALLLWALWLEPASLTVKHQQVTFEAWPKGTPPLKIVAVSDVHVGSPYWGLDKIEMLVEKINEQQPDIVLFMGDFLITDVLGGTYHTPETFAPILGKINAPKGVFTVLGNHDWWEDGPGMIAAMTANGIAVIENAQARIDWHGAAINLIGLADESTKRPDVVAVMKRFPREAGAARVVITHSPDAYQAMPSFEKVDLMLAGHTHGGQVNLPVVGALVLPIRGPKAWAYGWSVLENGPLFVTAGVGTSIFPIRFNRPPEIVVITATP